MTCHKPPCPPLMLSLHKITSSIERVIVLIGYLRGIEHILLAQQMSLSTIIIFGFNVLQKKKPTNKNEPMGQNPERQNIVLTSMNRAYSPVLKRQYFRCYPFTKSLDKCCFEFPMHLFHQTSSIESNCAHRIF